MSKSKKTGASKDVPVSSKEETPIVKAPAIEKPEPVVEAKKEIFNAKGFVENANIPEGTEFVIVTSDGQVFMPKNEGLARKHAQRKGLKIVKYTI